ncbi:hypothetical protein Bca52824_070753 [Brassica carinata]|uniref:Uncharacterized protein n=1 Tax=Brassica carinata TaxID=52824 RepID=A0A8X7Q4I3_BRACI|nr:hypothetical protein Bca52824_070753 [Brassica carinata]
MDRHKWRAVNMIMARTKQGIEMYLDAMKELEERARACYEGPIGLSSNKFTEMLVLDGCFVLELFRGADKLGYDRNDPVFAMRGSMHSIQRDMPTKTRKSCTVWMFSVEVYFGLVQNQSRGCHGGDGHGKHVWLISVNNN